MTRISKCCDACNKLSDELPALIKIFKLYGFKKNEKKKINLRQLQREE